MYKITKVLDHYEVRDVEGDITTEVHLTGNTEKEVNNLIIRIAYETKKASS